VTHGISCRPGEGLRFPALGVFSHPLLGFSDATSNCGRTGAAGCPWLHAAGNSSNTAAAAAAAGQTRFRSIIELFLAQRACRVHPATGCLAVLGKWADWCFFARLPATQFAIAPPAKRHRPTSQ